MPIAIYCGHLVHAPAHAAMIDGVASLHRAYFALVMAAGIVSIACHLVGIRAIAIPLVWLNILFFVVLWALTLLRVARFGDRVVADVRRHGRAVGFFTTVAATCVLGSQLIIGFGATRTAASLWCVGIALWAIVTYTVFTRPHGQDRKAAAAGGNQRRLARVGRRRAAGVGARDAARADTRAAHERGVVLLARDVGEGSGPRVVSYDCQG